MHVSSSSYDMHGFHNKPKGCGWIRSLNGTNSFPFQLNVQFWPYYPGACKSEKRRNCVVRRILSKKKKHFHAEFFRQRSFSNQLQRRALESQKKKQELKNFLQKKKRPERAGQNQCQRRTLESQKSRHLLAKKIFYLQKKNYCRGKNKLLSGKKTASTLAKKLREPDDKSNFRSIFKQKRPTIEKKRPTGRQTSRPLLAEMENGRHFLENGKFFLFFFSKKIHFLPWKMAENFCF